MATIYPHHLQTPHLQDLHDHLLSGGLSCVFCAVLHLIHGQMHAAPPREKCNQKTEISEQ